MEEDIIYDLEAGSPESHIEGASQAEAVSHTEAAEEQSAQKENKDSERADDSEGLEDSDGSESSDNSEEIPADPALAEIERVVGEMGAETLLEIIRDNRNAAIRQIISEVEASRPRNLPSGASAARKCASIFDLAALA